MYDLAFTLFVVVAILGAACSLLSSLAFFLASCPSICFAQMVATNRGHICTIASGAGHLGISKLTDYCASKFASVGLDESLRMELKRKGLNGVVTTCCSSYFISTGQFEGAKTSSGWFLPVLKEEYVADMIVEAIRTEQSELRMPRILYLVPMFKFFLPTPLFDRVVSFIGLNNSLDDFKGRPLIRLSGGRTKLLGDSTGNSAV
jgi:short-subunit dehydrogenase